MKQFESFELDTSNECLWREGVQIALAAKAFSVLRYLVENPGRLITHDELLDALWPTTYVQPQVLRTYILGLRKILGDDPKNPKFIQTIPKRGYSFAARVKENADPDFATASVSRISIPALKSTELVGRDEEIFHLQQLAQLAASCQRQVVFITGEAGIGKTTLINAFRELLHSTTPQAGVACGHCVEGLSEREQYYPVFEAFGQYFAAKDQEREPAAGIARLRTLQNRAGELCEAIEELAQEKFLVFIVEDIQWAHESTLELIAALARRSTPANLLVIATYRPQDRSTTSYLRSIKQDLVVRHLCTELALEPLSKQALKALLSHRLHQEELPAGLDSFIYKRSAGNPRLVLSLLEYMIAERVLVRADPKNESSKWEQFTSIAEIEMSVPNELATLIEAEIDRLGPMQQKVLEAGSLLNIVFPVWAVAAVLEEDSEHVGQLCDDLERRTGLVRRAGHDDLPDGTRSDFYTFSHEFYREVLYQRQSTGRRAKGHIRIAERLSALFAGREDDVMQEIATQYEAAGKWLQTLCTLRAGARHSHDRRAYQESIQLLEQALRIAANIDLPQRNVLVKEITGELKSASEMIARTESHQLRGN